MAAASNLDSAVEHVAAVSAEFEELLDAFCIQLPPNGIKELCVFCEEVEIFRHQDVRELKAQYLLNKLKSFGIINESNLQLLKHLAEFCGAEDLIRMLGKFEQKRSSSVEPLSTNSEQQAANIPGYSPAEFHVRGKNQGINHKIIERLCLAVANVSGIGYHELAWLGYRKKEDDMIVLMTVLPNKCLSTLQSRVNEYSQLEDKECQEVGIVSVQFVKEELDTVSTTSSVLERQKLRRLRGKLQELMNLIESQKSLPEMAISDFSDYDIDVLLQHAARCSNFAAIEDISRSVSGIANDTIVDVLSTYGVPIDVNLLENAYVAGREDVVCGLAEKGFVLHDSVASYSSLLDSVCQKKDYPKCLLDQLLNHADRFKEPFRDCSKDDVYNQCMRHCCSNDRADLVELFLSHGATVSDQTLDLYPTCIGRAMACIGCEYSACVNSSYPCLFVDICWQRRGLFILDERWLSQSNLGAFVVRLDLSVNRLFSIPCSLFDGTLPQLEELNCSCNRLRHLWREDNGTCLTANYSLRFLDASHNELEILPLQLFQIPSLEKVNFSRNCLTNLPGPVSLSEVVCDQNDSRSRAYHRWLCRQLKELDVSRNQLVGLPETFGDVQQLQRLNVAHNKIAVLPQSLCKAGFLEVVDLTDNCLGSSVTRSSLGYFPKSIQKLFLSGNKLGCVPRPLLSISRLRYLNCAKNYIVSLPYKDEWNLPHLETLILRDNELGDVAELPESFGKSITVLDLSHNRLKEFPKSALSLHLAEAINLESNPLNAKLPSAIATLTRLWDLKIDNLAKLVQDFDPTFTSESPFVGYSKVRHLIGNVHYQCKRFCGSKLTIIGSKTARNLVVRGLRLHPETTESLPSFLPTVSNLVLSYEPMTSGSTSSHKPHSVEIATYGLSMPQADSITTRRRSTGIFKRGNKSDPKEKALFKVWSIEDTSSFVVLQHVFFTENTIHLLVWHETDGSVGLDALEESLQLIKGTKNEVVTALVALTTGKKDPFIEERLDSLISKSSGLQSIDVHLTRQILKANASVSPLEEKIVELALKLANFDDSATKHQSNKIPYSYCEAASRLIAAAPLLSDVVCSRSHIEFLFLPDSSLRYNHDAFDKAMTFLRRIGALLHFEDTPRNLHEYFFPNIDLISRALVALTVDKCAQLSTGVAHSRHLHALFSKLSVTNEDSAALFALFVKLGVVVPLDCCRCLLPFRLPAQRGGMNLTFSQYLLSCYGDSDSGSGAATYVRRLYFVDGLPPSFWGQFISAIVLQIQNALDPEHEIDGKCKAANTVFWASGILAHYDEGCFVVNFVEKESSAPVYTTLLERSKRCIESGLDIVVFDRRRQFAALGLICSHIDRLLQEWIDNDVTSLHQRAMFDCKRLIPFPPFAFNEEHSSDEILNEFIFEHLIPEDAVLLTLEDCSQSIVEHSRLAVEQHEFESTSIAQLAPDLTLAALPASEHLNEEDVIIDVSSGGKLGQGGFASVFLGYHRNSTVAIKMFGKADFKLRNVSQLSLDDKEFYSKTSISEVPSQPKEQISVKHLLYLHTDASGEAGNNTRRSRGSSGLKSDPSQCFSHLQELAQEVTMMKQLQHRNIVQFLGVVLAPYPCLVIEFAPGGSLAMLIQTRRNEVGTVTDLLDRVHSSGSAHNGIIGRELTHRIAFQIALGIEHLHNQAICHLDLKPENVLVWSTSVTDSVNVKLSDYGISCSVTSAGVTTVCGTQGYRAPEQILTGNAPARSFDSRVDVFAYSMMMYYLLAGVHPYESDLHTPSIVEHKIRQNDRPSLPTGQSLVHLQGLINRCWRYYPSGRPSASQIIAEICLPSFQIQCEDLVLSGNQKILAATLLQAGSQLAPQTPDDGLQIVGSTPVVGDETLLFDEIKEKRLSTSFSDEVFARFNKASLLCRRDSIRNTKQTQIQPQTDSKDSASCETQEQSSTEPIRSGTKFPQSDNSNTKNNMFALMATNDSLLLADLQHSCFIHTDTTKKVKWDDVSAVMFLNDRLWIGSHSKTLQVFECIGGEIAHRSKQSKFCCNDSVQDIQCQVHDDHSKAEVYAKLDNGEILVFHGHRYKDENSFELGKLNRWETDTMFEWDHPTYLNLGNTGPGTEDGHHVNSRIVLTKQGELWYCQGNTVVVINTENGPGKMNQTDGNCDNDIAVPIQGTITDAVVLGDCVWCCSESSVCMIDVASRNPTRYWTLEEMRLVFDKQSSLTRPSRKHISRRLSSIEPTTILCLATVCDTLWIGCDNGTIFILCKTTSKTDKFLPLAILWSRPILNHIVDKKEGDLPSVDIARIKQVGDRVMVSHNTYPVNRNKRDQRVVAEVYQALTSSQLKKLTAYYNSDNA